MSKKDNTDDATLPTNRQALVYGQPPTNCQALVHGQPLMIKLRFSEKSQL
jgi:hypothetical protein